MLVYLLNIINQGLLGILITSILNTIFQTTSPVLLFLGHQTFYLRHTIRQVTTREVVCTN